MEDMLDRITAREASAMLGVSEFCLAKWRSRKLHLPFYKLGGRAFYLRSEVKKHIKSRRVVPVAVPVAPTPKAQPAKAKPEPRKKTRK